MASLLVGARRRAQQRDHLPTHDASGEDRDRLALILHLSDIATPELGPADRRAVLAVVGGVQLPARTELRQPLVPGLGVLAYATRSVAADEEAVAVVGVDGVVPTLVRMRFTSQLRVIASFPRVALGQVRRLGHGGHLGVTMPTVAGPQLAPDQA